MPAARQSRTEGTVVLRLIVKADGTTTSLHAVSGPSDFLNQAAVEAVTQWKFDPATYEGKAVDVEMNVAVNFRLTAQAGNQWDQTRSLYTDADEAYRRSDYQTAANFCRRIVGLSPEDDAAWNLLGRSLLGLDELDAAADAFATSIKINPASSAAYNNLGLVYRRQHKYDDAAAQFRKQIIVNPDDPNAHSNLGMMFRDQKKCSEAMPELDKGLALSPNRAEVLIALAECDIDLGRPEKGFSELEQAISASSAPGTRNSAAYALAKRTIELERAERWSNTCLSMELPLLRNLVLDQLTPEQFSYATSISTYWDTRGWIYFERGDDKNAEAYLNAAWRLHPSVIKGIHLAQVYESTNRKEEAIRTYAMAIAAADLARRAKANEYDVADATERLARLDPEVEKRVAQGKTELAELSTISVANPSKIKGRGDFTILVSGDAHIEARRISGDATLDPFVRTLQTIPPPIQLPQDANAEVPLRGTLTCKSDESQCSLTLLASDAAVDLARKEMAANVAPLAEKLGSDPHIYDSAAMGMRITLPDEWIVIKEEPGSFSRPHSVTFGKPGSLAMFMLTREHLEASQELYKKTLEAGFSRQEQYQRNGEESVTRDGLPGTRWSMNLNKNGIAYTFVTEFFTVGDEHYRLTALAPKEIYDRYAETFANIMRSVKFPMLHTDPRILEGLK